MASGWDAVNTIAGDSSPRDVAKASTKFAIKATIYAIGFSNPITGAVLGVADAFGATDAFVNWLWE